LAYLQPWQKLKIINYCKTGPGSYIEKLVMALGGSGSQHKDNRGRIWYDVNCFNSDKLPYITLNLENKEYLTISPKDYVKRVKKILRKL
jgi:hypothetical protein